MTGLDWDVHVKKLIIKLRCGLGMLKRSQNLLTSKAKRLLYFGQIHSNLCYCLSIWGTMIQKKLMDDITGVQKKAVKLIDPTISASDAFTKYNILPFDKLVRLEQCKTGLQVVQQPTPIESG